MRDMNDALREAKLRKIKAHICIHIYVCVCVCVCVCVFVCLFNFYFRNIKSTGHSKQTKACRHIEVIYKHASAI